MALWRTGLLLCFLGFCGCLEEECVLGIVGRPVSLPCFYNELSTFNNFSFEWRRGDSVVFRISAEAALAGDLSLELPIVDAKEHNVNYSLLIISEGNHSAPLCTVCLRIAASFSSPLLQREEEAQGDKEVFVCHSGGGFPEPAVDWLINDSEEPPEGSVRTLAASLPDSHLYNITSHLTINIPKDSSVSCIIKNLSMNETFASTSYGVQDSPVVTQASDGVWMFSTALSVVVGLMVLAGIAYQIRLDRINKRKEQEFQQANRGHRRRNRDTEETEAMNPEPQDTSV